MLKFAHEFEEVPQYGDLSDDLYEAPLGAKIEFSNADNGIWLSANSEGFLYLARMFAELGSRDLKEGYHFHRPEWLRPAAAGQEVSVEVLNGNRSADAQP